MIPRSCRVVTPNLPILSVDWLAHVQGANDVGFGGRIYLRTLLVVFTTACAYDPRPHVTPGLVIVHQTSLLPQ